VEAVAVRLVTILAVADLAEQEACPQVVAGVEVAAQTNHSGPLAVLVEQVVLAFAVSTLGKEQKCQTDMQLLKTVW
jgi:hypothetical protein